jgi:hypothetical protein
MEIKITEEEILSNSNDSQLGSLVRKKYWDLKDGSQLVETSVSFVSDDGFDKCVICGRVTQYHHSTPVDMRIGYVEGAGQTCDRSCRNK